MAGQLESTANENISSDKISAESVPLTIVRVLSSPYLRATALRCVASIIRNFFLFQFRQALLPGRIPVTKVDHPLDKKIPFLPGKITVYLDFVAFWVRCLGFLLKNFGRRALEPVRNFIETMGALYETAAEVYRKNLSTTERPFYLRHPRFLIIRVLDPHLLCVPSLHVMIVIRTYTFFREALKTFGCEDRFAPQTEELFRGALAITEAVLYVKQHSVNCIPAALYAMTRFDPGLFPPAEAERFTACLFLETKAPGKEDAGEIRKHILSLYRRFLAEGESDPDWTKPLLGFLKSQPVV
jgi:hypothetical protein